MPTFREYGAAFRSCWRDVYFRSAVLLLLAILLAVYLFVKA